MNRDRLFSHSLTLSAGMVGVTVFVISLTLLWGAWPCLKAMGFGFFTGQVWDPVREEFGVLPFLAGTLLTSFLALGISLFFSLPIAILLGEYFRGGWISNFFKSTVDLIAAVPSVIYGYWGLIFLVPVIRELELKIDVMPYGVGIFTSALVLSIMVIPNTAAIAREVFELVPATLKEAAYAHGATRYEVIRHVIIPYARTGIFAGIILSLGRALGETMAVTMVIGNTNELPSSLFGPGNTMASVIANELAEATGVVHYSSLVGIGLVLFIVTTIINYVGTMIIKKFSVQA